MPSVSVIIPTYNRYNFLCAAVRSVLEQTFADYELIIVDDGSDDGTRDHFIHAESPVRYIHQDQTGVSAARNKGIRSAGGKFIAFLDSDDYWLPEKLSIHVEYMQKHPEVLISQTEEIWIRNGARISQKSKHKKPSGDIFDKSLELCIVSPSTVMMRKEFFDKVGLFDERLPVCEDYDLWLRTACQMEVPLIPEALTVKQGGHDDQLSKKLWGIDRFRVYALQKLFAEPISKDQREKVISEIRKKCSVLVNGAMKRHRYLFAFKASMVSRFPAAKWSLI